MVDEYSQYFNIPLLLKSGDLDVRGVAAKNVSLTADEYFREVELFVKEAPRLLDSLARVADLKADNSSLESLNALKDILATIGYSSLTSDIDYICNEIIYRERISAGKYAANVLAKLNPVYDRTKSAYQPDNAKNTLKTENFRKTWDGKEPYQGEGDPQPVVSLQELLQELDEEEATRKLRILAVDDNSFMLKTIAFTLDNDYELFILTKGTMVERFLQNTTPELFLLDYNMPELNGFELVPIIRSFKEHKDTPIIFLTAMGTAQHIKTAISIGACDYVVKPVNSDILRGKVAKHIRRKFF